MQWTLKLGRAAFRWEKLWPSRVAWPCWTANKPAANDFDPLAASIRWHVTRQKCPLHQCSLNPNCLPMPCAVTMSMHQTGGNSKSSQVSPRMQWQWRCLLITLITNCKRGYELTSLKYNRVTEPAWVESIKQWAKTPSTDNLTQQIRKAAHESNRTRNHKSEKVPYQAVFHHTRSGANYKAAIAHRISLK